MGTNYKGTKKEIGALNTYIKLIRASDSVTSRINTSLSAFELTESQFNVLDALYHLGSLSQRELGRKLLKSGGNITMVIDNLEKTGLVERRKLKEDRRQYKICLTRKGKERIGKIIPQQVKLILKEMKILNESEQTEFQRLCKKIGLRKE